MDTLNPPAAEQPPIPDDTSKPASPIPAAVPSLHLTVDTSNINPHHGRSTSSLSPLSAYTGKTARDTRKNSACSALTDDTLIGSDEPVSPLHFQPASPSASKSHRKGKQKAAAGAATTPCFESTPLPGVYNGYGTIDADADADADVDEYIDPSHPIHVYATPRELALTLDRVRQSTPRVSGEGEWWDEEAQIVCYLGHRKHWQDMFRRSPALTTGESRRQQQIEGVRHASWWRPRELNRRNVGVAHAVFAVIMLFFYLYAPKMPHHNVSS